jgi:hypothetical protein
MAPGSRESSQGQGQAPGTDSIIGKAIRRKTAAKLQASAIEAVRAGPNERTPNQLAALQRLLNTVPVFSGPPWEIIEIARSSAAVEYQPGQSVALEGTLGCAMFIVLRGSFAVCSSYFPCKQGVGGDTAESCAQQAACAKHGGIVRLLEFGDAFGEHALKHAGHVYTKSLVSLSRGLVLRIGCDDYRCGSARRMQQRSHVQTCCSIRSWK